MSQNEAVLEQPYDSGVARPQVVDPDRSVDEDHEGSARRLGTSVSPGSLPPSLARRRALSRWMRARKASRTRALFSLVPVSRCASATNSSSREMVVERADAAPQVLGRARFGRKPSHVPGRGCASSLALLDGSTSESRVAVSKGRSMADTAGSRRVVGPQSRAGYELAFEDAFDNDVLHETLWFPYHLPQWSSREASAARYDIGGGVLRLIIEADQEPWCPEFDGETRVSSLQTGVFAGPVGSTVGQHRFNSGLAVRQAQHNARLYTPQYGLFELRAKAIDDPRCMVALWMIGYEDEPGRSAEICICEIFGRDVKPGSVAVGMGVHPFGDPTIVDDFTAEVVAIDAREFHVYAAEWTPEYVAFFVDDQLVKTVQQSPGYPMQFMLGIYEFPDDGQSAAPTHSYPKPFTIDYFRGYRLAHPNRAETRV